MKMPEQSYWTNARILATVLIATAAYGLLELGRKGLHQLRVM